GSIEFTDGAVATGVNISPGLAGAALGAGSAEFTPSVPTMTLGGSNLNGFFGVGGPYKTYDSATGKYDNTNSAAVGLQVSDVNFALAIAVPQDIAFISQSFGLPAGGA